MVLQNRLRSCNSHHTFCVVTGCTLSCIHAYADATPAIKMRLMQHDIDMSQCLHAWSLPSARTQSMLAYCSLPFTLSFCSVLCLYRARYSLVLRALTLELEQCSHTVIHFSVGPRDMQEDMPWLHERMNM